MKVAFGLKAHSGWAALVVVGNQDGELQVVERQRIELVENDSEWARQPYHAAESLDRKAARDLVKRSVKAAHQIATREMKSVAKQMAKAGHEVGGCAVLVGNPMPDWSVEEILAVHFRMHQAEGVLFRDALVHAANACALRVVEVPEKQLLPHSERALKTTEAALSKEIARLGKSVGAPWGKDQKEAALAAIVALRAK